LALAAWTTTNGAATARSRLPISSDATPIQAEFAGVVKGSTVEFTVRIAAFVSGDEPTSLNLPWTGLQLQSATLDGQSVTASIANHEAKIPVTGRGRHDLTVTFTADCRGQDVGQIDFPIAEVCDCTLSLRAPESALNLDALTRQGAAYVTSELGFERLEADLGRVDRIRVGWNRAATAIAAIRSDEAYLWVLEDQSARLIGDVKVEIIGAAEKLQLVIPNGTTVKSMSARPGERGGPDPSLRLRDWKFENKANSNRLTLEFSRPISGRWQIEFELVPTTPLSPDFTLEFPQVQSATGQSVCAWRASGVRLEEVNHGDLSPITPGEYRAGHSALPPSDSDRPYRRPAGAQSSGVRLRLGPDRPAVPPHSDSAPRPIPASEDRHSAPSRKTAQPEPELRMTALDFWSVEIGNGAWVHQLTSLVDASAPVLIALVWPQSVEVLSLAVDDETLVISEKSTTRIVASLDRRRLNGTLVCVWRTHESHDEVRSRLPRIDSARRSMTIESANWRIMPLPGRSIEGPPAGGVDTVRSDPQSATARLQLVDRFADRSRPVWSANGRANAVTIVDATSADNSAMAIRTGLLLALLTAVAAFSWYVRLPDALETFAALALVAAVIAWEWPWLLPAAFALALRAANVAYSWRFAPRSAA
jgi:hypothetical protein